jgi:hypothetical protein
VTRVSIATISLNQQVGSPLSNNSGAHTALMNGAQLVREAIASGSDILMKRFFPR